MRAQTEKEKSKSAAPTSVEENSRLLDSLGDIMENQLGISKADQFFHDGAESGAAEISPSEHILQVREAAEEKTESPFKFNELLKFYLTGIKPAGKVSFTEPGQLTPALLHSYRDLSMIRYDYPLCLPDKPAAQWVMPLKTIFDNLVEETVPAGEEGAAFLKELLLLESHIKFMAEKKGGGRLTELWDNAAKMIVDATRLKNQKKDTVAEQLTDARKALKTDGMLVPCDRETPRRLLQAAENLFWREKVKKFGEEINALIIRLKEVIKAGETRSPQAYAPEGLKAALGTAEEELDFDAFSDILSESAPAEEVPEKRQQRVAQCLKSLETHRQLFSAGNGSAGNKAGSHWLTGNFTETPKAAIEKFQAQSQSLLEFFKSVRMARLELENRYREETHDAIFAEFSLDFLSAEEWRLFPPVILSLDAAKLKAEDKSRLVDIFSSNMPVKVLLRVDDLFTTENGAQENYWATRLARMVLNLNNAFVLQTTFSNVPALTNGLMKGLNHEGPALFAVYTGGGASDNSDLPLYMASAAALESRAYPAFIYSPEGGDNWALQFSVEATSQYSRTWPVTELSYLTAENQEANAALEFTYADFLATDKRFADHYLALPRSAWNEKMVPLHEFLQLGEAESGEKLPYILMVDNPGNLWRVLVNRRVVERARQAARDWRSLQELGGINNSHALNVLDRERKRLEEEKQLEVQEIESKYETDLAQSVDELTREIVAKIAAGLLSEGMAVPAPGVAAPPAPKPATAAPKSAPEETTAEEAAVAEEEVEAVSFDEPYVDTPLCTSCNDCINLNNKMFAYDENKQAIIKDASAGTYRELVLAAEKCPVHIIHPGKPKNPDEAGLDELIKKAEKYN